MARSMNNLVDRDGLDENLTVFLGDSFFDFGEMVLIMLQNGKIIILNIKR